jgi:hypothetical protein
MFCIVFLLFWLLVFKWFLGIIQQWTVKVNGARFRFVGKFSGFFFFLLLDLQMLPAESFVADGFALVRVK